MRGQGSGRLGRWSGPVVAVGPLRQRGRTVGRAKNVFGNCDLAFFRVPLAPPVPFPTWQKHWQSQWHPNSKTRANPQALGRPCTGL